MGGDTAWLARPLSGVRLRRPRIHGKNGNGRKGKRKIGQLEKSAAKQGNTKIMCEITATEKKENGNRKLGNEKIRQRKLRW